MPEIFLQLQLSFCIAQCGKGDQILQKFEYFENKKSFLDERKGIFHSF